MKVNWGETIWTALGVLFLSFIIGMTLWSSQSMTDQEKTDFILMLQQWE